MCDYSLHAVAARPARVGDTLVFPAIIAEMRKQIIARG
jgi:hypothetical protein